MLDPAYFLAMIPLAWLVLSLLMARLSGWSRLAKHFRCRHSILGEVARLRGGRIGAVNYPQCLTFRIADEGLWMATAFPLRFGHPPLLIPWDQIHKVEAEMRLYSHRVKFCIGRPTIVRAILPAWVRYRMPLEMRV